MMQLRNLKNLALRKKVYLLNQFWVHMNYSLFSKHEVDVVISIGCLIKRYNNMRFEHIASSVSCVLMDLRLKTKKPVVTGILDCLSGCEGENKTGFWEIRNYDEDRGAFAV